MAIDENLIGEVRPSESAIDRLRKRNRIRPWESALVGSQAKSQSESEGVGNPPPGQPTQRADAPEGGYRESDQTGKGDPVGDSPTRFPTHGVKTAVGGTPPAPGAKSTDPLGKLPSGSPTERVDRPLGIVDNRACKAVPQAAIDTPTGVGTHRAINPGGELPSGLHGQGGTIPSGFNSSEARRPVGDLTPPIEPLSEFPVHSTQRVIDPRGKLPTGSRDQGNIPSGSNTSEADSPEVESATPVAPQSESPVRVTQRVTDPLGAIPIGQDPLEPRVQLMTGFDPTPFVPVDKGAVAWREKGSGELRIPHRLYEFAHRVTSTRNELLVFDCLLRFSLGFHRSWCEAGYSFIAAWTGISDITNIKKSLKTLLGAGLVVKAKEHNSAANSGSIYELPVVKGYLEYVATRKERLPNEQPEKNPLGEIPSGSLNPGGATPPARGQETHRPVGDLPPKKENSNKTPKKTLSQERSADLDAYVDQIKPASKRESEIHFLGKLLSEYSSHDVALSVTYIQRFGVLGSKEPCHSPLKYLAAAIEQVLPKAREYATLLAKSADTNNDRKGTQNSTEVASAQDRFRATAIAAFETELDPIEQDKYLADATRENSVKGYAPPLNVLRSMAAMKWLEEKETRKAI